MYSLKHVSVPEFAHSRKNNFTYISVYTKHMHTDKAPRVNDLDTNVHTLQYA